MLITFALLAALQGATLPADFPGLGNPTPYPPPVLVWVVGADGLGHVHMTVHPEWDPSLTAGWVTQTPPAPITLAPGTPYQIAWTWTPDPNRPVKFRLWLDGVVVKNFIATELTITGTTTQTITTNAGVVAAFTAAQRGARTMAVTAFDADGESDPKLASVTVQVGYTTAPPAPSGVAIKVGG